MKIITLLLLFFSAGISQHEVILLSPKYTTSLYSLLALSGGATQIDETSIFLAGKGAVYIQPKGKPDDIVKITPDLKSAKHFLISSVLHVNDRIFLFYLGADGMHYLCSVNMSGLIVGGPERRHGRRGRIMQTNDGLIVQAGLYRPRFTVYLDRYDDESGSGPTERSKRKFKELYETSNAFFLSFYDESLTLVDSVAFLPLKGEAAKAYEDLYLSSPMDIDKEGTIYFIDHLEGYVVNEFNPARRSTRQHHIWNEAFLPIPKVMSLEQTKQLNTLSESHSRSYALFTDNTYILTSFVQNDASTEPTAGPYYVDVMTISGEQVFSMTSSYPVVTEDHESKIFFAVEREAGWFEPNEVYLVGLRIQDVINGLAEKDVIDRAVDQFKNKKRK